MPAPGSRLNMQAECASRALLVRAAGRVCALRVSDVIEVMRPLPVQPVPNVPAAVRGVSIVRGATVPVVSLTHLFGPSEQPPLRFVILSLGQRRAALAVDAVLGVADVDCSHFGALPPLLAEATQDIQQIGTLDGELLYVLETVKIVPEETWAALPRPEST